MQTLNELIPKLMIYSGTRSKEKGQCQIIIKVTVNRITTVSLTLSSILLTCCMIISAINQTKTAKIIFILLDNRSERSRYTRSLDNCSKLKPIQKVKLSVYPFGSIKAKEKNI